jgi:hypothetical protein
MTTKGKKRAKLPTAGKVVGEIHAQLIQEDAAVLDSMVRRFELALQTNFRGPEHDVRRKLSVHLAQISRLNPPPLPWVDWDAAAANGSISPPKPGPP